MRELLIAVVLGVVEGLTEFVPVSSTGHLIVVGHLLGFEGDKTATFQVFIQLGAVLAVTLLYRNRFLALLTLRSGRGVSGRNGWGLIALTTLPVVVAGATTHGLITERLFTTTTVAVGW